MPNPVRICNADNATLLRYHQQIEQELLARGVLPNPVREKRETLRKLEQVLDKYRPREHSSESPSRGF